MKKLLVGLRMMVLALVLGVVSTTATRAQDVTVSYQTFYDELSPYGQWIYDPDYGNVWIPNEEADFRPYSTRGRWGMTEYGNMWLSDDPWGWAVYHYGRWTFNPYYGWVWVPGYEWAPAWVSWRYGGGYCGWAPMGPGFGVGMTTGYPDSWWVFVGPQYLYNPNPYQYWGGPSRNTYFINRTTYINNVYVDNRTQVQYNFGPRASVIQQVTNRPVQVYRVSNSYRPGGNSIQQNTVSVYRPVVNRNTATTARPSGVIQAPRNIGRPQSAVVSANSRQPTFRQELPRQAGGGAAQSVRQTGNTGVVGPNVRTQGGTTVPHQRGSDRFGTSQQGRDGQQGSFGTEPVRQNDRFRGEGNDLRNRQLGDQSTPNAGRVSPSRINDAQRYDGPSRQQIDPQVQRSQQPAELRRADVVRPQQNQRFSEPSGQQQVDRQDRSSGFTPREQMQPTTPAFEQNPRQERVRQESPRYNSPAQQEQPRYNPPPQREQPRAEPQRNTQPPQQEQPRYNPPPQREQPRAEPQRYTPPPQQEQPRYNPPPQREQPRAEPPRYTPPPQQEQPRYNPPPQREQPRAEPPRYNPPPQREQPRAEPARNNPPPQQPAPAQRPSAPAGDPRRR
jgi:hypothetical protein